MDGQTDVVVRRTVTARRGPPQFNEGSSPSRGRGRSRIASRARSRLMPPARVAISSSLRS